MTDWTLGSFLLWLALAVMVPGILIHRILGRKGGHHLFDKDKLSADQIKNLPLSMVKQRTLWSLKGTAAAMIGLAAALALYPLGCLLGLPINIFGISDQKLVFYVSGAVILLATIGPALARRKR